MRKLFIVAALAFLSPAAFAQDAAPSQDQVRQAEEKFYQEHGREAPAAPQKPGKPPQKAAAPAPAPAPVPGAGCAGTGDLSQLLSPECMESLRALRAPNGPANAMAAAPPPPAAVQAGAPVQCTVSIFSGPVGASSGLVPHSLAATSFSAPSLERCIEIAARLSYGVPGITNIAAADALYGVVAISCRREPPSGQRISCQPQPSSQGRR